MKFYNYLRRVHLNVLYWVTIFAFVAPLERPAFAADSPAKQSAKPENRSDEGVTPTAALRTAANSKLVEAKRLADKKRYADGFRKALDAWQTVNGWRPSARNAEDQRLMADAITVMKSCSKKLSKSYISDEKALVLKY